VKRVLGLLVFCAAATLVTGCKRRTAPTEPASAEAAVLDADRALGGALPGAPPLDSQTATKLESTWNARASGDKPRTRHLRADGSPKYTNRLVLESSPYLLQHAHNPVNWYPWGDDAFETATKLGRPVLLSIGYSTCHWCHVMEEESFEDEEIARYLNENYVAIKVDREERPDVDAVYMNAVQALTGSGGWPMTTWLTTDRKPFYGGTYFPARDGDRGTRTGFLTLLRKWKTEYEGSRNRVAESGAELAEQIRRSMASPSAGSLVPAESVLDTASLHYWSTFDATWGGTRQTPKFPSTLPIRFLLRHHRRSKSSQSLQMATLTLEKMARGGMYDHIGGGFHRYSTDARWIVPHFEKMLYDNARLAMDYLEAYQVTRREDFARVAREILRYVGRDMTSKEGAFYSATDADSPGEKGHAEEGRFFTWKPAELRAALGDEHAKIVIGYYGVTEEGNFEGRSILHVPTPLPEVAATLKVAEDTLGLLIEQSRELLYAERAKRPPPGRDEKILTAWNGLMVSAYARAALVFGDPDHARRAASAADFVLTKLRKDGRLFRTFKDGEAKNNACLDDYAFLIAGLLDLFEVTGEPRWLKEAISLDRMLEDHFEDKTEGGFFLTRDDHAELFVREKPAYDGAEPSGNSIHALNLLRLEELGSPDHHYGERAERTLKAFYKTLSSSPSRLSEMLLALDFRYDAPKEIVIVAPKTRNEADPFLARLRQGYVPNRVLSVVTAGADQDAQSQLVPALRGKIAQRGKATAYVCEHHMCELPTTDPEVFGRQIQKVRASK